MVKEEIDVYLGDVNRNLTDEVPNGNPNVYLFETVEPAHYVSNEIVLVAENGIVVLDKL